MKQYINFINNRKTLWILSFSTLILYFLPYFVQGKNIHVIVYDNLDSSVVWFKLLAQSDKIFADSMDIIPNMMNGLPRLSYGSEFNMLLWLYYFSDDFIAYMINDIFIHIVAFFGMLLLLSNYFIEKNIKYYNAIVFTASLLFAIVPFWSNGGLSIAGQPLVLYVFLNIRAHKDNKWDWLILFLVPLYSSFVLSFSFFLFSLGVLFLYDSLRLKCINYRFLFAIVFMTLIFLLVNYRLVDNMLISSHFVSHRTEFDICFRSFSESYRNAHLLFLNGQDHNINLQYKYILPLILTALLTLIVRHPLNRVISLSILLVFVAFTTFDLWNIVLAQKYSLPLLLLFAMIVWLRTTENKLLPFLFIVQIIISYWTGFLMSDFFNQTIYKTIPFLHKFHLRFMMLQTLIWYILLALSMATVIKKIKYSHWLLLWLIVSQIILAFEYRNFTRKESEPMTYKTYYAEDLFNEISRFIGKDKNTYRVVSLGIEPAVSLYNGFYTVDGYSTNYPLAYKHAFRKIIENYLNKFNKHEGDKFVIDDWGSKLYLLTGDFIYGKKSDMELNSLNMNMVQLRKLGANYIFSIYKIKAPDRYGLKFLQKFENSNSYWTIYLYEITNTLGKKKKE